MARRTTGAARAVGPVRRAAPKRLFVVQQHAARRLHYDLRLELDGVLKSWAVTKGPSLSPRVRRLAVEVDDHPLAYADFEGVIPPGEYGAGAVIVWDRGYWRPVGDARKGLQEGHLAFTLEGRKLQGGWRLVRMRRKPGEKQTHWLLIKADDEAARTDRSADIAMREPGSVVSGLTLEEIAEGGLARPPTRRRRARAQGTR
jgi:bifunctional non-homologous end joining protein LigD